MGFRLVPKSVALNDL